MTQSYDVAVIGLGAMGAHAVQQLAARGLSVIGIERFGPLHDRGSSHGDSRLIRLGYFEDPAYVPLLRRAYANWRALETRSREKLLTITGVLQVGRPEGKLVAGVLESCRLHSLAHEVLDAAAVRSRYPAFAIGADEVAVLEPEGGFLRPEQANSAALKLAGEDGAVLHFNERVRGIEPDTGGVTIVSDAGRYRAGKVIVAAGSYIAGLVPELAGLATPIKQVVGWYASRDRLATELGRMPGFLVDEGTAGCWFGFPDLGEGVKTGKHGHFFEPIDPELPNPPVNDADRAVNDDFMARRMPGVVPTGTRFITCRYTILPGEDFLIDFLPGERRVIVASPCSGHGFKFASVVGEILADLAIEGGTELPIDLFSFEAVRARAASA
ncbi:MAG TPA: N-methyl-L-tryptophan oxidase [Devosiaceae bacterium]|nr:N-methyl-L-tryptophan oxidase [Devosiaceae bacterium]